MVEGPLFILVGNSPYLNRGYEAIARATVAAWNAGAVLRRLIG